MATASITPLPRTGDYAVDLSLTGHYWQLGSDRTIRWSISNGLSGEYWNNLPGMVSGLADLLNTFSYYANIKFQYAGFFSSPLAAAQYSDLNYAGDAAWKLFSQSSQWARAFFPDSAYDSSAYVGAPGDIYLNIGSPANYLSSYAPGSAGYFVFLHETGHALGLKHTHDDGGTGHPTLQSLGISWLDKDWFSIMSYGDDYDWNLRSWDPATPMLLDVIGLQYLYGPNMSTNAGDSIYTLSLTNTYMTIWDAGGNDQIDVSASTVGWQIYLPNLQLSSLVSTKAGVALPIGTNVGSQNSLYWLTGDIEDVKGSAYNDYIFGSDLDNKIKGNSGNDYLAGLKGNDSFYLIEGKDAIFGGEGIDTLYINNKVSEVSGLKLREGTIFLRDINGNQALCRDLEKIELNDGTEYIVSNLKSVGNVNPSLVEIYVAAFKRAPEKGGYEYWSNLATAKGLKAVADVIFSLDIVKAIYPQNLGDTAFVTSIYNNVFNKPPDTEGLDYWVSQLKAKSRGELVMDMASVALVVPDGTAGKDFFQNRVDWAIYATAYQTLLGKEIAPTTLATLTNGVTENCISVITLIGQGEAGTLF